MQIQNSVFIHSHILFLVFKTTHKYKEHLFSDHFLDSNVHNHLIILFKSILSFGLMFTSNLNNPVRWFVVMQIHQVKLLWNTLNCYLPFQ